MSKPVGRPPKPVEQKRRAGNPGKRPLPDVVIPIPTSAIAPEPHRPLGSAGRHVSRFCVRVIGVIGLLFVRWILRC